MGRALSHPSASGRHRDRESPEPVADSQEHDGDSPESLSMSMIGPASNPPAHHPPPDTSLHSHVLSSTCRDPPMRLLCPVNSPQSQAAFWCAPPSRAKEQPALSLRRCLAKMRWPRRIAQAGRIIARCHLEKLFQRPGMVIHTGMRITHLSKPPWHGKHGEIARLAIRNFLP